jgi:hypothetical protein
VFSIARVAGADRILRVAYPLSINHAPEATVPVMNLRLVILFEFGFCISDAPSSVKVSAWPNPLKRHNTPDLNLWD